MDYYKLFIYELSCLHFFLKSYSQLNLYSISRQSLKIFQLQRGKTLFYNSYYCPLALKQYKLPDIKTLIHMIQCPKWRDSKSGGSDYCSKNYFFSLVTFYIGPHTPSAAPMGKDKFQRFFWKNLWIKNEKSIKKLSHIF